MCPSDRTEERLKALEKAFATARLSPESYAKQKAKLEALGPSWEARWTLGDKKTERTKTFRGPGAERKAAKHEEEQQALVRLGLAQDPQKTKATIAEVLEFYLQEKLTQDGAPRVSYRNVRAHKANIIEIWGPRFTFEALDNDPEPHMKLLKKRLKQKFPGGHWNNKVTLRAAIAYWCRRKRLHRANPVDIIDWEKPKNARKEFIHYDGHRAAVGAASRLQPAWLPIFLECGWETGWRSGEVQDWEIPRMHLEVPEGDYPWIETLVQKQGEEEAVYEEKPISRRLAGLLRSFIGNRTGGSLWPLGRSATDRWVRRALNDAGQVNKRFHDYRRSIKKRLKAAGVMSQDAADYAGHDEDMHARYERGARTRQDYHGLLRKLESVPGHFWDMEAESE